MKAISEIPTSVLRLLRRDQQGFQMVTIEDHHLEGQEEDLKSYAPHDDYPTRSVESEECGELPYVLVKEGVTENSDDYPTRSVDSEECGQLPHVLVKERVTENSELLDSRNKDNNCHCQVDREGDDWETASEGDDEGIRPSTSANVIESYEDALSEEEQSQKALAQANSAKVEGNELYATGKYEEALERYVCALEILSEYQSTSEIRAMCYSNRAVCFLQLGNFKEAVTESSKALELNPVYVKALLRRAHAEEKLEQLDEALADMKKVLELDPGNKQARDAIRQLEPLAAEKREKMKEEMIGKLKELGNSILGNFGMSVDNFKAVQDPNTGSYSISFQR